MVGKASFDGDKIKDNVDELLQTIVKLKPSSSKGVYIKSLYLSSTMSPSIQLDTKALIA
jgi:large subunit ribosomal protein L1